MAWHLASTHREGEVIAEAAVEAWAATVAGVRAPGTSLDLWFAGRVPAVACQGGLDQTHRQHALSTCRTLLPVHLCPLIGVPH